MQFDEKFIAFVDVLGFKDMVKAAECGMGMSLPEIMELLEKLGSIKDSKKFEQYGPTTCPNSKYLSRDLNFKVTQISDCAIVSSEVSPAGLINLISHCWGAVIQLLMKGIMCRGYITKGLIYHSAAQIIGSGYQKALQNETNVTAFKREADERGTPFVEIDPIICDYVRDSNDSCVKEMFSRYVKEQEGTTALFPFKRLSHSFIVAGHGCNFDPEKEKKSNQNIRQLIFDLKNRVMSYVDASNKKAENKARHYITALDSQLEICNRTDEFIDKLCQPFPSGRIKNKNNE